MKLAIDNNHKRRHPAAKNKTKGTGSCQLFCYETKLPKHFKTKIECSYFFFNGHFCLIVAELYFQIKEACLRILFCPLFIMCNIILA